MYFRIRHQTRAYVFFARDYVDFGDFAESYKLENCFEILLFQ